MHTKLEIRELPLSDLKPAPYNPRKSIGPAAPAYKKLASSLREFGLVEPLVWNETSGHVVGGHLRLQILRELGVNVVPVSVVRLSPIREKALNVVLNNREAQGRFDVEKLAEMLEELQELREFELTGFDERDLKALQFEPVEEMEDVIDGNEVTVTLTMPAESYESVSLRLDAIVAEFDVRCHVNRSGE
jgi:ParB-like chromosome segregation protein Spo0J